jgi:cytochrome P450
MLNLKIQSSSTLHAFILAMVLYPEVQAKAQAEIDTVVGLTRLPDFDDRPSLPYIEAILREMSRWNPLLPLGMHHCTDKYRCIQSGRSAIPHAKFSQIQQ